MSVAGIALDDLSRLEEHLVRQCAAKQREPDFDMNDAPDGELLAAFPQFAAALDWLAESVTTPWREADAQALISQARHRLVARVAIVSGTSAVAFAVIQLATKLTFPSVTYLALYLELMAVAAAAIAVTIGVWAKIDRSWLGKRHLAERLRMLRFRALEQLWCHDPLTWRRWVEEQRAQLDGVDNFARLVEWSKGGDVEPLKLLIGNHALDIDFARALTTHYRVKRLYFQASYFKRRREAYERQVGRWPHVTLPLFLTSVACVLVHFLLEFIAHKLAVSGRNANMLENVAVWFVALAAIIPVIGSGVRAWFAAFEVPRSASLFEAKQHAIERAAKDLAKDSGDIVATQHHMSSTEHFLEHEHREWLRLLRETEWFL